MWIWTANKFEKFHIKRLNLSENILKSFRDGATFFWNTLYILQARVGSGHCCYRIGPIP